MLDQTCMTDSAVDHSRTAIEKVMGFTSIPETAVDKQQVQRT